MFGSKTSYNENDHLLRSKNEKKDVSTPRRPFNLITNQKTPSSVKRAVPKSTPIPITIFEDDSLEKVEEAHNEEQNSFNEICAEFEKKNRLEPWNEYPDIERFSTAPPLSPFCEREADRTATFVLEPDTSVHNTSFDELCAQLYIAPDPYLDDKTPIEKMPTIIEGFEDFQIDMDESVELYEDGGCYTSELTATYPDSEDEIDEASYFVHYNEMEKANLDIDMSVFN